MDEQSAPKIGQIVKILRGRDHGKYGIVIKVEGRYAYVVDGDKRKFDQPKKKNLLHLEWQKHVSSEVVNSMAESGRVTNGKIRFALNRFFEEQHNIEDVQEKGE